MPDYRGRDLLTICKRKITRGVMLEIEDLKAHIREKVGDLTFEEAFEKTGYILNITVTGYKEHDNHRLLNYITAPNVLIWSAASASSAVPGVFDPVELMCKNEYGHIVPYIASGKQFIDGTVSMDIPSQRIAELFNVNTFIVSQVNPFVLPFLDTNVDLYRGYLSNKKGDIWRMLKNLITSEIIFRFTQLKKLNILPDYIAKLINLVTQSYEGSITIVPKVNLTQYLRVFSDTTSEEFEHCKKVTQRRTYHKLTLIESYIKIENLLNKLLIKIKQKINNNNNSFNSKKQFKENSLSLNGSADQDIETKLIKLQNEDDILTISENYNEIVFN